MVRLVEQKFGGKCAYTGTFQFLDGAIGRVGINRGTKSIYRFNSLMVRLVVAASAKKCFM